MLCALTWCLYDAYFADAIDIALVKLVGNSDGQISNHINKQNDLNLYAKS